MFDNFSYYRNKKEGKCTIKLKCENQSPLCTCTSKVICSAASNATKDNSDTGLRKMKENGNNIKLAAITLF